MVTEKKCKVGLVLEGGSMRGLYTAGVIDVFMDEGIEIDGIIGVSAGALFGPNYFSKQRFNLGFYTGSSKLWQKKARTVASG